MARSASFSRFAAGAAAALAALLAGSPRDAGLPAARHARVPAPLFDPALAGAVLEDPGRDRWQKPEQLVRAFRLRAGETVADVGAGSGYLLPHLSRAVGPSGVVYAQEIQAAFLPALRRRAARLDNVRVLLGSAADPGLPEGAVDCLVLLTVYHEVREPVAFLRTLRRAARPGARLAIVDFDAGRGGFPPAPAGHDVAEADVLAECAAAGWRLSERHEMLSSQFVLLFTLDDTPSGRNPS